MQTVWVRTAWWAPQALAVALGVAASVLAVGDPVPARRARRGRPARRARRPLRARPDPPADARTRHAERRLGARRGPAGRDHADRHRRRRPCPVGPEPPVPRRRAALVARGAGARPGLLRRARGGHRGDVGRGGAAAADARPARLPARVARRGRRRSRRRGPRRPRGGARADRRARRRPPGAAGRRRRPGRARAAPSPPVCGRGCVAAVPAGSRRATSRCSISSRSPGPSPAGGRATVSSSRARCTRSWCARRAPRPPPSPALEAHVRRRPRGTAAAVARAGGWPAIAVGVGDPEAGTRFASALVRALDTELPASRRTTRFNPRTPPDPTRSRDVRRVAQQTAVVRDGLPAGTEPSHDVLPAVHGDSRTAAARPVVARAVDHGADLVVRAASSPGATPAGSTTSTPRSRATRPTSTPTSTSRRTAGRASRAIRTSTTRCTCGSASRLPSTAG